MFKSVAILAALVGLGCAGDGTGLDPSGNPNGSGNGNGGSAPTVSLASDVQPILSANCALSGCHAGSFPAAQQNLSAGNTFGSVVNVAALGAPGLVRVKPGEPDSSYLVHKIQGTQGSVGGGGSRMPLGRAPLTSAEIQTIRDWIADGAADN